MEHKFSDSATANWVGVSTPRESLYFTFHVKKLREGAQEPKVMTLGSVGMDLFMGPDSVSLTPGSTTKIPLGISIEITNPTIWAKIESRSSLAAQGVFVVGGIIDPDYRGELCVLLHHSGFQPMNLTGGSRIAQLVFHPVLLPKGILVNDIVRGVGGFGSSDVLPKTSAS
jgi:dUTP pyrophosphatase